MENKREEEMTAEQAKAAADRETDLEGAPDQAEAEDQKTVTAEEAAGEAADREDETVSGEDGDGENPDTGGEEKKEAKKSGFFKKKEKKDKRDDQIADLTDRLQRQMAEFDNFRKRTEKEKAAMYQIGARDIIEKLLPVVDNFERGLAGADESDPFVDGMNKIYKQIQTMFEELDVKAIEAVGAAFDPNLHNAVMHEDDPEVGENIITLELLKGYTYKDTVVRHSMVKVAN